MSQFLHISPTEKELRFHDNFVLAIDPKNELTEGEAFAACRAAYGVTMFWRWIAMLTFFGGITFTLAVSAVVMFLRR